MDVILPCDGNDLHSDASRVDEQRVEDHGNCRRKQMRGLEGRYVLRNSEM